MNKDIECKHKELQNLMKIQENWSRRNGIHIDGIVESGKQNWKDTDNKLHQMLYDSLDITEGGVIERAHRVEKRDKSEKRARTIVDTNVYIHGDFPKETMAIRKLLWEEVKKLRQQGKYAVVKYDKTYFSEFHTRR